MHKTTRIVATVSLYVFILSVLLTAGALVFGRRSLAGPLLIVLFSSCALACMRHELLKRFVFTIWVFAFVAASLVYPSAFGTWFKFDLKYLIVPLIQIIMFGMGTTLSIADFGRVFKVPWPVLIGMMLQFTVMPLAGYTIGKSFGFGPEVAAGVILIGSCPGGVASNLMTFLAGGDVALSVTMTSCSTLVSPVMTPFLMQVLAGRMVPIDFFQMMFSILNMIIVPILAGLVANRILYGRSKWSTNAVPLVGISVACISLAVAAGFAGAAVLGALKLGVVIGLALIAAVSMTKFIISILLKRTGNWMDRTLSIVSMAGICFIIAIITARSREDLLAVGAALLAAVLIHNFIGYTLGYWLSRAVRLDEKTCRTVAFEVGMQNGGMASGLAMRVLNSSSAALAPAIFGPWMNVSGSILATWWHRKPVKEKSEALNPKS